VARPTHDRPPHAGSIGGGVRRRVVPGGVATGVHSVEGVCLLCRDVEKTLLDADEQTLI